MSDLEHRLMLTSDVENYSGHVNQEQIELQQALTQVRDIAAGAAGFMVLDWKRQPQGDGEFAILPPDTDPVAVLAPFVPTLARAVEAVNTARFHMRVRLSVHQGPIHVDGPLGSPGAHAVQSGRLVAAEPLRVAMRACKAAYLGVIVSERIFEDYVGQGYGGPSPEEFRHVHVKVKADEYRAYVYLPGHNVHRLRELDVYDVVSRDTDELSRPQSPVDQMIRPVIGRDRYGDTKAVAGDNSVVNVIGRDGNIGGTPERRRPRR